MAEVMSGKNSADSDDHPSLQMKVVLAGIRKKFSSVKCISTNDLQKHLEKDPENVLIFDVREKEEYNVSHLENSVFVDESWPAEKKKEYVQGILSERMKDDYAGKDRLTVYAYCSIGYRSSALLTNLLKHSDLGKENVQFYDIAGGIFQWANENRAIVDAAGKRTDVVHPYNAFFGKLVKKIHRYKPSKN